MMDRQEVILLTVAASGSVAVEAALTPLEVIGWKRSGSGASGKSELAGKLVRFAQREVAKARPHLPHEFRVERVAAV